jgi:Ca2+-binding RTX toxin-like protein
LDVPDDIEGNYRSKIPKDEQDYREDHVMTTFTGTAGADVANAATGVLTGFTGGVIGDLQDATGDSITGADNADTIVAGIGNDTIRGGLGTDSIDGGNGDDRIQVTGNEFSGAEYISGGGGTGDILEASGTINFDNGLATLTGIETLLVAGTNPYLTFSAAQFQNFTGMDEAATGTVDVIINVSTSFSLAPVVITGWNSGNRIWLLGSSAANTLTAGGTDNTRLAGHGGADTLIGGASSTDYFLYYAAGDVEAGEVIDGGTGPASNYLSLAGPVGTIYDFTVATIANINVIDFSLGGGGTAYMPASLFIGFAGGIAQIFGSYGADTIITTGSQVNMGAAQFYFDPPGFIGNWDASVDRIIINGTSGQDTLTGSGTNDSIYGLEGDDRINPFSGADYVDGGDGFDIISYGILGLAGLTINMTTGVLTGEAANDTLVGFEGVSGTSNADDLTGDSAANRLEGQNGNDTLTGLGGADTLVGGYGDDSLQGGDGFDVFEATHELDGSDIMRGGAGFDIVSYAAITSGNDINVTLNGNTLVTVGIGGGNSDSIVGIEGIVGAAGEDSLSGDSLANFFRGMGANDSLYGFGGSDTLEGSDGDDLLTGGSGLDTASYGNLRGFFSVVKTATGYTVSDLGSGSNLGTDTVSEVERFEFSNATASLETFTPVNLNGDLMSDLVWTNTATGDSSTFLMNGTTITSAAAIGAANGASWRVKAVADLNGDGSSDLIWQNSSGLVVAYLMNGTTITTAAVVGNATSAFAVVGVGDLNGDGKSDIVLQDGNGQAVGWLMDGAVITSAAAIGAANGAAWRVAAVGDLNLDGRADLVWNDTPGSTVGYLMDGLTITSAAQIAAANGTTFSVKAAGDLNGDGLSDIIWQYTNGQAGAWLMSGNTILSGAAIGGANGAQFEIRDVADLNGDSRMDLVWQNTTNGQAVGFLMNGTAILSAANIGAANGADWLIV